MGSGCDQKLVQNPALPLTMCVTWDNYFALHCLHLKMRRAVLYGVGIRIR